MDAVAMEVMIFRTSTSSVLAAWLDQTQVSAAAIVLARIRRS